MVERTSHAGQAGHAAEGSPSKRKEMASHGGNGGGSSPSRGSSSGARSPGRQSPTSSKAIKVTADASPSHSPSNVRSVGTAGSPRRVHNGGRSSPSPQRLGRRGSGGEQGSAEGTAGEGSSPGRQAAFGYGGREAGVNDSPTHASRQTARRRSLPKSPTAQAHDTSGKSDENTSIGAAEASSSKLANQVGATSTGQADTSGDSSSGSLSAGEGAGHPMQHLAEPFEANSSGTMPANSDEADYSGDVSVASSNNSPVSLSATLSRGAYHQCGTARRVKVYELQGETWLDRGTGYCAGVYDEQNDAALLVARMEETCRRLVLGGSGTDEQPMPTRTLTTPAGGGGGEEEQAGAEGKEDRDHYVLVVKETLDSEDLLLRARVVKEDVYQRQQDTLIVWTEPDGTDMALSFQEADGCHEVWEFLTEVQKHFLLSARNAGVDGFEMDDGDGGMLGMSITAAGGGMTTAEDELVMADGSPFALPDPPRLENLHIIDLTLKDAASRSPQAREKVAEWILREDYIMKLIQVFRDAEDFEVLDCLHRLCAITHTVIMLNDNLLVEKMLRDESFLGVVGMLEYDPEFPRLKASYREYLTNVAHFRQVVPIPDETILAKIHQTFRLQYLKDVILARTLDDSTFAVLNSLIFYHQADIVMYCTSSEQLLSSLFQLFEPSRGHSEEKKAEAIIFLQQLCAIGKQVQLPARMALYRTLTEWGLLIVLEYALSRPQARIRNAAAEMLMSIIEYDATGVRAHILEQVDKRIPAPPLLTKLANVLHEPHGDLGLKTQITEALRILFDSSLDGSSNGPMVAQTLAAAAAAQGQEESARKDEADRFLNWFYEGEVDHFFAPLKALRKFRGLSEVEEGDGLYADDRSTHGDLSSATAVQPAGLTADAVDARDEATIAKAEAPSASPKRARPIDYSITTTTLTIGSTTHSAVLNHLCELLTFIVVHHHFRSQYWVISSDIGVSVASLLYAREKHLRLAALRFFRACLARGNQFVNRHFVKIGLLGAILSVVERESARDNLVTSACLEFFEHIRKQSVKPLISHLMEQYETRVRTLTTHATIGHYFQAMILSWEKGGEQTTLAMTTEASMGSFDGAREQAMQSLPRTAEERSIDAEEEQYFHEEDEEGPQPMESEGGSTSLPPYNAGRRRADSGPRPYTPTGVVPSANGTTLPSISEASGMTEEADSHKAEMEEGSGDASANSSGLGDTSLADRSLDDSIETRMRHHKRKKGGNEDGDEEDELLKGRMSKRASSTALMAERTAQHHGDGKDAGPKKIDIRLASAAKEQPDTDTHANEDTHTSQG